MWTQDQPRVASPPPCLPSQGRVWALALSPLQCPRCPLCPRPAYVALCDPPESPTALCCATPSRYAVLRRATMLCYAVPICCAMLCRYARDSLTCRIVKSHRAMPCYAAMSSVMPFCCALLLCCAIMCCYTILCCAMPC